MNVASTCDTKGLMGHSETILPGKARRILFVGEEDASVRAGAQVLRERFGCIVETAHSGSDGCAMVGTLGSGEQYNVIIADVYLPDMSGYELLRKLKEAMNDVPMVMACIGNDSGELLAKARQAGLREVLFKPFRVDQLLEVVGRVAMWEARIVPLRVFLSYGHDSNEELVRQIKADLEARGHDVWFDKNEIKSGDNWRRAITDGIVNSDRVLSFLSKHSTRDPGVCRDEIAIAIGVKGGNIQTVLVESEEEVQPPVNIGHIQWLDMRDWKAQRAAGEAPWNQWYQAKFAEIVGVVESDESRRFAGEIETLNGLLKPIKSDARIYGLLRKGFFGRAWLFEAVEQWRREKRDSRLFWITGDPGVGKSAFAAQLAHTRPDVVIAAQFVEWDKPDHRNPQRVIRSLAFQLATRLPDYRKLLLTLPEIRDLDGKNPAELFDYLLANRLRIVIGGGREQYLIVIDALDEAGEAERNPLVEMLARHAHRLPAWLGIVVTSRPESAVVTQFQELNPFVLHTRTEANRSDLRNFICHHLAAQLKDHPDGGRLVELVLEKSEGIFLYVEQFCNEVLLNHISLHRPETFPQGLGGILLQWCQRQFSDLQEFRKEVRPALRAILAAREPLPFRILQCLFNWQSEELRDFVRALGSLFPVTRDGNQEFIKPYHKSLTDWLVDESKAGPYFVNDLGGHRQLADEGIRFLSQKDSSGAPGALSGYWYWARNLLYHLRACKDWDRLAACISDTQIFQHISPGSYGYARAARDPDAFAPSDLDDLTGEFRNTVPWAIAEAFAKQTRALQLRAYAIPREKWEIKDSPERREYWHLLHAFVNLAELPPQFAMSKCQVEQIGSQHGKPVFRPRDTYFAERAKSFLKEYAEIYLYIDYLAEIGRAVFGSTQLEDEAFSPNLEWHKLRNLASEQQRA